MAKNQEALGDMKGKVALVTGATTGIGKEIARGLVRLGADVIIGARGAERGEAARSELAGEARGNAVTMHVVDVSSIASVRSFANDVLAKYPKLHLLVNNAGVWMTDRKQSAEGHELTFATNVLGPYLLTNLLAERLAESAPARVVNIVSSIAKSYDATDLEFTTRAFSGFDCYAQSKAALQMLTWSASERLSGRGVLVNAAAPGFVKTEFNRDSKGFLVAMINLSAKLFGVTPDKGADTPLWVATAESLAKTSGKAFDKRAPMESAFRDPKVIAELEAICAKMTDSAPSAKGAAATA